MKILIINGPNLNFLGIREPQIYGHLTYNNLKEYLSNEAKNLDLEIEIYQSNHEGSIIDKLQEAYYNKVNGIVINAGAYTHYSYAILDAIKSTMIPTIEVHLSDITKRESFRANSVIRDACIASYYGKGFESYKEALIHFKNNL